jgi:hypothetical protein
MREHGSPALTIRRFAARSGAMAGDADDLLVTSERSRNLAEFGWF